MGRGLLIQLIHHCILPGADNPTGDPLGHAGRCRRWERPAPGAAAANPRPVQTGPWVLGCVSFNTAYEHDVIWRWVLELDRKRSRRRHAAPLIEKSCAGTPRADTDAQITLHK